MSPSSKKNRSRETVKIAGALVWRENGKHLGVFLVHRPRYDDWSIPKGKVESCESVRIYAVREVAEETGVRVVLGQPLSRMRYRIGDGSRKEVHYWAARVVLETSAVVAARCAVKPASARKIDGVEWLRVGQARKRLTYSYDRDLLGEPVDLWEDGELDTWTLVLVRHGRAVKRSVWSRPKERDRETNEATRPLTHDQGETRARALVPVLAAYGIGRVITNPWERCVDTVAPYATAVGLDLETAGTLTEMAHAQSPKGTRSVVRKALRVCEEPMALCTHRPVLPTTMKVVLQCTPEKSLRSAPDRDPWFKTGEIPVVHMARRPRGKIRAVAIEKQHPVLSEGR